MSSLNLDVIREDARKRAAEVDSCYPDDFPHACYTEAENVVEDLVEEVERLRARAAELEAERDAYRYYASAGMDDPLNLDAT